MAAESRIAFHLAIEDPTASETAVPRESIEIRVMCFWKKENCKYDSMPPMPATIPKTTYAQE